ncbi:Shewanella-like protein phosphatase 2 [Camellia lanceoleosa]|uniref:Shewanella-like protein phosphatase 2 n=1 Tax=Camellia lanceoleosa TaxID=1840588 RepID=A0ACC0G590_9ERIC|nr:Shewanella-like protein phosphatase 2 [Camellia lanceoleosa]
MNGNHEIMNIDADFRFVTKSALDEFRVWADWYCVGNSMKSLCDGLEKPKDLYRGLPLVFRNLKQEISDGVRARFAVLRCCDVDVAMLQTLMFIIFLSDPMFSM